MSSSKRIRLPEQRPAGVFSRRIVTFDQIGGRLHGATEVEISDRVWLVFGKTCKGNK